MSEKSLRRFLSRRHGRHVRACAAAVVVAALQAQAARGLTTMLPSEDAAIVGRLLAERFGLPFWQVTATASDANRSVIRWARAATGREKLLVFNGCYHGAVDDTFVALKNGQPKTAPGLVGEVRDVTETTRVVEFNDIAALESALTDGEVALVLCRAGHDQLRHGVAGPGLSQRPAQLTRKHGTLLVHRRDPHHHVRPQGLHRHARPRTGLLRPRQTHRRRLPAPSTA